MVNEFEDIEEDEDNNREVVKTKKYKNARIKNLHVQAIQTYELLAQSFWESHLRLEEKHFFLHNHDAFDSKDD